MKRIATIQDFSCAGRCSLTVALPIISAAGVECCALPTAVLSTHTGGFIGYTVRSLTDEIMPIAEHWKSLNLAFDVIYTGYLSDERQIGIVCRFIDMFKGERTKVIVDPAMADHGQLYSGFDSAFVNGMRKLCSRADIVVPNLTEAALLNEKAFNPNPTESEVKELLSGLKSIGAQSAVVTGISFKEGTLGASCIDEAGKVSHIFEKLVPKSFHGTGDIFASVLAAATARGKRLVAACSSACRFTTSCIAATAKKDVDERYGVLFEEKLGELCREFCE